MSPRWKYTFCCIVFFSFLFCFVSPSTGCRLLIFQASNFAPLTPRSNKSNCPVTLQCFPVEELLLFYCVQGLQPVRKHCHHLNVTSSHPPRRTRICRNHVTSLHCQPPSLQNPWTHTRRRLEEERRKGETYCSSPAITQHTQPFLTVTARHFTTEPLLNKPPTPTR